MTDIPPGYGLYADVLARLGPLKETGSGLTFQCLFPDRHKNGDRNPSCRVWIALDGSLMARCMGCGAQWEEIVEAAGTQQSDWWPNKGKKPMEPKPEQPKPKQVAVYQYRDRAGKDVYQKVRYEPGYDGRGKTFKTRRPLPQRFKRDGDPTAVPKNQVAWVWGLSGGQYGRASQPGKWDFYPLRDGVHQQSIEMPDEPPVLYHLPDLLAARPGVPVFVVEGEKDADTLAGFGFVAVCGHAGANTWLLEWSDDFAGRRVVVVPDHNTVGYQHANFVAGSVLAAGCESVRVVKWAADPESPHHPGEGGGIGNWLARLDLSDPKAAVVGLVTAFPEYRVAARPEGRAA